MKFVIVTGLSGSGKSYAMNALEDIGFYCIDNMPPQLISKFVDICQQSGDKFDRIAVAADVRSGEMLLEIITVCEHLTERGVDVKILYLEANNEVLIKRYKETRRKHPLDAEFNGSISKAIECERDRLNPLRGVANYYIDTSYLSNSQLKEKISSIFLDNVSDSMFVNVMSFGFKYGSTTEADLVFDVRCLPNPFYIQELKGKTGCDDAVRDYVMSFEQSSILLDKIKDLCDFLIPLYIKEGKSQLVVSFGCTGGKHRSVTFAELFADYLTQSGYKVHKTHRDITKDR